MTWHERLNLKRDCTTIYLCATAQLHRWAANCTFKNEIVWTIMGTIAGFAVKPFCSNHFCKHYKWLKLFSALTGLILTPWIKFGKTRTFQGIGHKDKDKDRAFKEKDKDWTCKDKDKDFKLVLRSPLGPEQGQGLTSQGCTSPKNSDERYISRIFSCRRSLCTDRLVGASCIT